MSLPGTLAYAAPRTTQAAREFRFPARPSCPRINNPANDTTFSPGDPVSVTIETNRGDLDHSVELIDAASGAVVDFPVTIPAGSDTGTLNIPSVPNESKEFFVRVYVATGGHFEHRVLINTRAPLTVSVVTAAGPAAGTYAPPQTVTLEAPPAGGATPYDDQWRLNGADVGGETGQQLTTTMSAEGEYRFTVHVTESGFGDEVESGEVVYDIRLPFAVAEYRRGPDTDPMPADTEVVFVARFEGGRPPYGWAFQPETGAPTQTGSTTSTTEVEVGRVTYPNTTGAPRAVSAVLQANDAEGANDDEALDFDVA
jgi:hypothetical protein